MTLVRLGTDSNAPSASEYHRTGWQRCTDGTLVFLQWSDDGLGRLEERARAASWKEVNAEEKALRGVK